MGASVEWLTGIVRAGPDHHKYGDPYEVALTVVVDQAGRTVTIKGLDRPLSLKNIRAFRKLMKEYGFTYKRERFKHKK